MVHLINSHLHQIIASSNAHILQFRHADAPISARRVRRDRSISCITAAWEEVPSHAGRTRWVDADMCRMFGDYGMGMGAMPGGMMGGMMPGMGGYGMGMGGGMPIGY